MGAPSYKTKY